MIQLKTPAEIKELREGGGRLAQILSTLAEEIGPGVTTSSINEHAHVLAEKHGGTPAFFKYQPSGAPRPYPAALCVSVNDVIVHGIPNERDYTLQEGDIVTIDMGLVYNDLITDSAVTLGVGKIDPSAEDLLRVTRESLEHGIQAAEQGATTGDIGSAIETFVRPHGYALSRGLAGHGVGHEVHEEPFVPNTGTPGHGERLEAGLVIAIEPMLTMGTDDISTDSDGFTIRTADGSLSAHFEHTIAITENGPEVLTRVPDTTE
ncbi:MAG: type I methionyl aminopeptidase [Candidatus Paceibacterota bacterium]